MKKIDLGKTSLKVPQIAVGCMRINRMEGSLPEFISHCVASGLCFFDHADIYGGGECERLFAKALSKTGIKREDIILQSKCGIRRGMYDFSKEYILESVKGILERLDTDYLDVLLLHRPDALCEPEEVAEAFDELHCSGMVKNFGVSNHNPYQIELLKKYVKQDINVNQLQLSITESGMISSGVEVNMTTDGGISRDGGVLDYCRINDVTVQSWSPFQYGRFQGTFIGNEKYKKLNETMDEIAEKYGVTPTGIAAAWILRHPAKIQLVTGTTRSSRMDEILKGSEIELSRQDWYRLYLDAGHILP